MGSHNPEVVRDPAWAGNWLPDRLLYARRPDLRRPLPADELAADAALRARAWAFVKEHPGLLPWLAWRKEVHTWELYLRDPLQDAPGKDLVKALGYKLPFAIFLLAAAVELRRRRRLGIYALPAYVVLLVAATHGQSRYRLPADPVWMAVAAWGWRRPGPPPDAHANPTPRPPDPARATR